MTGRPDASSNRLSTEGGSGAEAERTKRMRPGRTAGGFAASRAMIAGTALIQVTRCASISSQKPRRLNLRSSTRHPPERIRQA